jgi:glycosyltransferase involved in cell wall biosynthesis
MGRWLCRRPPILFTEHGRHHPDCPSRKRVLANRALIESRDRVVGVGAAVRQALIDKEGIPADRVGVIYNGIPLGRFADGRSARAEARAELGLDPDELMVLQVARLDPLKDHATAIAAMAHLRHRCPRARLVLAGEGPRRGLVEGLVSEHGLQDRVRLLGLRKDVPRLMAAADVFLLSSVSEGIPLTLIEAMAAGLPVVSTDVGGVAEVVSPGDTGLLAPAGDGAALADHVLALAGSPDLRAEMGRRGALRATEVFAEEQMHAAYRACYEEMCRG